MAVLNKHHKNIPADAIYIGRGSIWGNPFVIGRDGDRNQVCDKYEAYLTKHIRNGTFTAEELDELHGKDLVCFCAPARCHGDTLEKYAAKAHDHLEALAEAAYIQS
jgi:hypothetical protein